MPAITGVDQAPARATVPQLAWSPAGPSELMSSPIVLSEKLRRPDPAGLSRPRLERPLLRREPGSPVGTLDLVVAPAGSGKTTLLAQVAAAAAIPVAWYRVTSDDETEPAFAAHLDRALALALSEGSADVPPAGVNELLARWDRLARPALLILDDVHEIGGTPAERALESFVALRPPSLQVLVAARRQPELNIPRLRLSGLLREWTGDDLRFRSWEVEELFVTVFGEPLPPEAAAALTRRTAGWAAALQLFHLSTAGRSAAHRTQAVAELAQRSRLIRTYLVRNVLEELPEHHRSFLVRTSPLGVLTGELCDQLLGTNGSHLILDDLERRQMFTSSDDDGQTFRYHEVLRSHLELALIDEYGTAGARTWYQRSADLLEAAGQVRAALRAYARAENWAAVTRLIREQETTGGDPGRPLGDEFMLPPGAVFTDPWLALTRARRLVRTGAMDAAVDAYRRADALLDEPDFRAVCRDERARVTLWSPGAEGERTAVLTPSGTHDPAFMPIRAGAAPAHWSDAIRRGLRVCLSEPVPTGRSGPGWELARAATLLLAGDFRSAGDCLDDLIETTIEPGTIDVLARLTRVVLALLSGDDRSGDLGQIAVDADTEGLPWAARVAHGLFEAAQLPTQGTSRWRAESCERLSRQCEATGDAWGAALIRLAAAVCGALAGAPDAVTDLAEAAQRFERLDAGVLRVWVDTVRLLRDGTGDPGELRQLAVEADRRGMDGVVALLGVALADGPTARISTERDTRRLGLDGVVGALLRPPAVAADEPFAATPEPMPPAAAGPVVTVRCFGRFQVLLDGAEWDLTGLRPLPRTVLRLLALSSDGELHRERLVDLLWPDVDLITGTRRLQVAVSSIRQALEHAGLRGAELVRRSGDSYRLVLPDPADVDVRAFEQHAARSALARRHHQHEEAVVEAEAALACYRGDLLPEDGAADHVVSAREGYRLAAAEIALGLARELLELGRLDSATAAVRRSVDLDPYRDESWRLQAEIYDRSGNRSAAHRTRSEHERVIASLTAD